jgi:hypothetical protein
MASIDLFGYIDPGSGFIALQIFISGVIGCIFFFRRAIWNVVRVVTGRGKSETEPAAEQSAPVAIPQPGLAEENVK